MRLLLFSAVPLLLQIGMLGYSLTPRGQWLRHMDGNTAPGTYVGASWCHWYYLRIRPLPPGGAAALPPPTLSSPLPGVRSITIPPTFDLSFVHMAWTLTPNALAIAFPLVSLARLRHQGRRQDRGLCPQCGYDLRSTPTQCPECGRPIDPDLQATLDRLRRQRETAEAPAPTGC